MFISVPSAITNDKRFFKFIKSLIISRVQNGVRTKDYSLMDEGIKKVFKLENIRSESLINYYVNTFKITERGDKVVIGDLNEDEMIANSNVLLSLVIRMIEYGTEGYPAVPCISSVLNEIGRDLDEYLKSWNESVHPKSTVMR